MAVTPNSDLFLIKCPLELDDRNQITFSDSESQANYFRSLPHLLIEDITYQRKDSIIRYPAHIDSLIEYNYCMYKNTAYSNKWFYAYITGMRYVNDNMTEISIRTDVFQTWQFKLSYKRSFIEREHVNDDTLGKHTVPESLETGSYICNSMGSLFSSGNETYIAIATTYADPLNTNPFHTRYNGVFSGTIIVLAEDAFAATKFLLGYDAADKGDSITGIYLIPKVLCGTPTFETITIEGRTTRVAVLDFTDTVTDLGTSSNITAPTSLDGYTPKNNKARVYPYSYFYVSNNTGADVDFHYEDFINNTASFKTIGSVTPGCSIRCVPLNYNKLADSNGSTKSYNSGITGAKYPICSWNTDVYTNWLTQNGVNLSLGVGGGVLAIAGAAAGLALAPELTVPVLLGAAATAAGGVGAIANTVGQVYEHSLTPPQAQGNSNAGDVAYSAGKMDIPYYRMTIRREYAEIIDNYFSMFGYKVNTVKVPNVTGRSNWNFVKTIGANIEAEIPQEDLQNIKNLFNNGITLWHTTSHYLDYSQNNSII